MDRWTQLCTHWQVLFPWYGSMHTLYSKLWLHRSLRYVYATLILVVQWLVFIEFGENLNARTPISVSFVSRVICTHITQRKYIDHRLGK